MNMVRIAASVRFAGAALIFAAASIAIAGPLGAARAADAPAPAPVGAEPQNTSATYGDWILRCSRVGDGAAAQRVCEIVQPFQLQGQQGVFAQLAIGRTGAKDPLRVTAEMPATITFPSTVKLLTDEKDMQPLELTWKKCLPGAGCFADAEFKDDSVKRWKTQTGSGRLTFKDGMGRDLVIPFSFRGLPQALDGLAKS
ncbi:MAG: invasion protein [Rhodospirillales bacterium]|nr:invasion protein [Rhodospirillales bacterium]